MYRISFLFSMYMPRLNLHFATVKQESRSHTRLFFTYCHGSFVVLQTNGPRSGPTKRRSLSGSKPFDTLIVFLKDYSETINFENNQQTTAKKMKYSQHTKGKNMNKLDPYIY